MLRFARTRRAMAASALAVVMLASVSTPAAAGDDLIVEPGDTLWDIALEHGTTVGALSGLNAIPDPSLIRIGQRIVLRPPAPPPATEPMPPAPRAPIIHVVQAGETLWAISRLYGTTVEALVAANLLADASFIRTGQSLVIPGSSAAPAAPIPGAVTNSSMSADMASKVSQRTEARSLLLEAADEFGVAGPFVLAVAWHESGWQPGVVSGAGAVGLMQLMPETADWVAGSMLGEASAIDDPRWNARAGVRLLAFYLDRYQGDTAKTLAAYFQGMTSVDQIGILQSTQPYVDTILALEQIFSH